MQSLPNTRGRHAAARYFSSAFVLTPFALLMLAAPHAAKAQSVTQVFFSSAPPGGTIEPIGSPYYLTVQGTDQYGVNALGVTDLTTGSGYVYGWSEPGCGPGGIHTFTVVNQADPPPGWGGFLWVAVMQGCNAPSIWFSTYSTAGLYPV